MLSRLSLEDFVIVERGVLEFSPGLNVLTGETGAGKSILIDAISFLGGGRASVEWVRPGAERLVVEGAIDLADYPDLSTVRQRAADAGVTVEAEGLLLLRREMGRDGRSRCFLNGRQVLVSQLRELTSGILWIVGQGEQRALTAAAEQEWLLDRFGRALALRAAYREQRARFLRAKEALAQVQGEREAFAREEDWLRFQAREIEDARIQPGERKRLFEARVRLRSLEQEAALLGELEGRLFREEGSILDHLESLGSLLSRASGERWEPVRESVHRLREEARRLRRILPSAGTEEEENPDAIEERLRQLDRLVRKYGGASGGGAEPVPYESGPDERAAGERTADERTTDGRVAGERVADEQTAGEEAVRAHLAQVQARIAAGDRLVDSAADAEAALESARARAGGAGRALSRARKNAADRFGTQTRAELAALGMEGASLRFILRTEPDEDGVIIEKERVRALENGLERVALHFRSHPSLPEGELGRVASGGELSRVLLAVHAALGQSAPPGCWVLDEVDQGIGGETAGRVADRLVRMAAHAQVLLVTHLPVIAARGERHHRVIKEETSTVPAVRIEALAGETRVAELARMLSGDASSAIARRHARELLTSGRDS